MKTDPYAHVDLPRCACSIARLRAHPVDHCATRIADAADAGRPRTLGREDLAHLSNADFVAALQGKAAS